MNEHKVFILFLILLSFTAVLVLGLFGLDYYTTPLQSRPFLENHDTMRPAGFYSHGLGIIGTALVVLGVSAYSTRKRIKALWSLGRLSVWLQFHIVLCLIGPILIIFHTTFKAGGVAAISLWTMISVWLSGMVGRFLYAQIPRSVDGNELSANQIHARLREMRDGLEESDIGRALAGEIDRQFHAVIQPTTLSGMIRAMTRLAAIKRTSRRTTQRSITRAGISGKAARTLVKEVDNWVSLTRKTVALNQVQRLFHYWHIIHLPFTVIMFISLAAHVAVTIIIGYSWVF